MGLGLDSLKNIGGLWALVVLYSVLGCSELATVRRCWGVWAGNAWFTRQSYAYREVVYHLYELGKALDARALRIQKIKKI